MNQKVKKMNSNEKVRENEDEKTTIVESVRS